MMLDWNRDEEELGFDGDFIFVDPEDTCLDIWALENQFSDDETENP